MADVYSIVRRAIADRQQIIATYGGHRREMCPHAIGTKNGRPQALFFQFGGSTSTSLPPGGEWRCLPLAGLSEVVAVDGDWHSGSSHSQPNTCIDELDLEVDY
ncbi:MAG: hypothetical protein Q8O56_03995 [Solirubrobacteraceae bacterium]|nr:hypothetical protein [Solirubrobacteraceae bacterium]